MLYDIMDFMRKYIILFLFAGILASGAAFAQTNGASDAGGKAISPADLGVENPGLLPTNPFYFLKEWRRGIERLLTFGAVNKAELELQIVNEKAAEALKVEETRRDDTEAIVEALKNYQEAQERLRARIDSLRDTSQNPNVDRLLDRLADRVVKHEKLFDDIAKRLEEKSEIKDEVDAVKEKIEDTVAIAAAKDDAAKFAPRFEKVFLEDKSLDSRSVEIVDRLRKKTSGEIKESFDKVRGNISERLKMPRGENP